MRPVSFYWVGFCACAMRLYLTSQLHKPEMFVNNEKISKIWIICAFKNQEVGGGGLGRFRIVTATPPWDNAEKTEGATARAGSDSAVTVTAGRIVKNGRVD